MFAPLDSKDYTQYFGQLRQAKPEVLYTSVAGNDTVRLLTQMQDFGLAKNLLVVGASGTVTSQNIGARRLHTILERVVEDLSFDAPDRPDKHVVIDAADVRQRLEALAKDEDLSRFIL